jgi:hypothetical protein
MLTASFVGLERIPDETTVKLDRLPSALCNQVASSKFLGFFVFDGLIRRDEVSCGRFAQ